LQSSERYLVAVVATAARYLLASRDTPNVCRGKIKKVDLVVKSKSEEAFFFFARNSEEACVKQSIDNK
jgi:hypothetical protein